METNIFKQNISKEIWAMKYRHKNESPEETYKRVADALFDTEEDKDAAFKFLSEHKCSFAGRIMYGVGTSRSRITFSNCYVLPILQDSMEGILETAKQAALTMKAGGGVGYNFSVLRPSGATITTSQEKSSGVVSFMKIFDTTCSTIIAGGNRRGAQMAIVDVWHPEVERVIEAKRDGSLSNFNISIGIYDNFMRAVKNDGDWDLIFPDYESDKELYSKQWNGNIRKWVIIGGKIKVYKTLKARELYNKIIKSNYEYAEPGVVFIDTVNKNNNLHYAEFINCTNPCGEQPLAPYGSCNLGSINLANFVVNPFKADAYFDFDTDGLNELVRLLVYGLDKVLDINYYPLKEQAEEVMLKRQIGIGVTGLGDMLAMLKLPYSSSEGRSFAGSIMRMIANKAYYYSALLAKEKGSFELFDKDKFLKSEFVNKLDDYVKDAISEYGIRNSRLLSIAPTGTISLVMNNVSSGIEPIFSLEYNRKVRQPDGAEKTEKVMDYAYLKFIEMFGGNEPIPEYFETAMDIPVDAHLEMQAALQKWVDTSISKTINIPADYNYNDFEKVYWKAWELGLKGCTTYRPNNVLGSVLSTLPEGTEKQTTSVLVEKELLDIEDAKRHRVAWKNGTKVYVNVSVDENGTPLEIFAKLPKKAGYDSNNNYDHALYLDRQSDWEFICRLQSKLLRLGYPVGEIIDDADKSAFTMHSLPALMKRVLSQYVNLTEEEKTIIKEQKTGAECPECKEPTLVVEQGCNKCLSCGYSKCG